MPEVLWKDGASRTLVLAGVGRERGSSAGAGEGLLSVLFTPRSQCGGFCFALQEKWQRAVRALIHRFLRHPSLYAVTVKTFERKIKAQQLCADANAARNAAGMGKGQAISTLLFYAS